jgi:hypothetical protein
MKRFVAIVIAAAALGFGLVAAPALADEAKPLLTVGTSSFDLDTLQKMEVFEVSTSTPWTDGVTKFEGVSAKALLASTGTDGTTIKASAADGYAVEIPREDLEKAIIAYKMNGARLDEQFGPYWIIYNYDSGLNDEVHHGRSVYQLKALEPK